MPTTQTFPPAGTMLLSFDLCHALGKEHASRSPQTSCVIFKWTYFSLPLFTAEQRHEKYCNHLCILSYGADIQVFLARKKPHATMLTTQTKTGPDSRTVMQT